MNALTRKVVPARTAGAPHPDVEAIEAMRRIIEAADVLIVEGRSYIVAPVTAEDVDALAVFEECDDEGAVEDDDDWDGEEEPDREEDDPIELNGDEGDYSGHGLTLQDEAIIAHATGRWARKHRGAAE